jgi:hypothetical protein
MVRLCPSFAIALIAAGAASADSTSGAAEPSSTPTNAIGSTSQSSGLTALPSMSTERQGHTATLLAGGQVLIAGGSPSFIRAELYEPAQQAFRPIVDMTYGRAWHTATRLPNSGFVLIVGGVDQSGIDLSAAELFVPASGTFVPTHPMTTVRDSHTATLLGSGQVLIAGGYSTGSATGSAELFNPTTRTFMRTGTMNHPRANHAAVRLMDGRVLITGGDAAGNTAEIFDPGTGRFSPTGSMLQSRYWHTATLISGGKVLIAGGWNGTGLSSAEVYDPASGRFSAIPAMSVARAGHTATTLLDGTVLIAGGAVHPSGRCGFFGSVTSSVERFNPITRQFAVVTADYLPVPREGHRATRLLTGDVLVTGGLTRRIQFCFAPRESIREYLTTTATADLIR